ncbi:MAG: GNAT family N-acetyltransferase [Bacteroidales bacterium]|jgi:RimJ/RimL family protein N-acetyltransferase|nr:GNAT family N-acetyltransferase [Bacteroidales bacterium]
MRLVTDRLLIRAITPDDRDKVFEYRKDKKTNMYQGWIPETIDDVDMFIGKVAKKVNMPDTWFQLVIVEMELETVIGDIGIHFIGEENNQVEIGCTLNKRFHKRGYATEAVKAVIDYLFTELNKHRIITSVDPANVGSIDLVERIGFRKEAHFVESLFINGEWVDDAVYALLKKEWKIKKSKKKN